MGTLGACNVAIQHISANVSGDQMANLDMQHVSFSQHSSMRQDDATESA